MNQKFHFDLVFYDYLIWLALVNRVKNVFYNSFLNPTVIFDLRIIIWPRKYSMTTYLGHSNGSNVFWITCSSIAGAPESGNDAANSLGPDATIDGVNRRWWSPGEPRTGVVVADGFNGRGLMPILPIKQLFYKVMRLKYNKDTT